MVVDTGRVWHEDRPGGRVDDTDPSTGRCCSSDCPYDLIEPWVEPKVYEGSIRIGKDVISFNGTVDDIKKDLDEYVTLKEGL